MTNNFITALEEQFNTECEVINLKYEYLGYTGTERFAIVSSLSEMELRDKYSTLISAYEPFIILFTDYQEVRSKYNRNEHKHSVRLKCGSNFDIEDDFEEHHPEVCTPDFTQALFHESNQRLRNALMKLKSKQRERLLKMYYEGYSNDEIAMQEGVSASAISQSISGALKKLEEILQKP